MKILLFGEYSGFFNCLKDGLVALGHDVFLVSDGNGYKNFPSDFRWDANTKTKLGKFKPLFGAANMWMHKNLLRGYDVVLLIAPTNFSANHIWLNKPIYEYLLKHNKKVFLSGSGISAMLFDYWYDSKEKYHYYMEGYFEESKNPVYYHNAKLRAWEDCLMKSITGYIPIWYEYAEPFRKYKTFTKTVRIPININQLEYKPNRLHNNKIVFYHGVNRMCKGTRFIEPAFDKMRKDYSDKAEFICARRLPFNEYMKVVERTNVIVDDANSYSIAMNGLFSLLKGKIIMGGAEPIANEEYGYEYNPVFNICPDVDQICDVIKDIISRKDEIEDLGLKGRKFVEQYHDYIDIAQQYVDIFNSFN